MDEADRELAGAALAEARRAKRLSQGDVARRLNVSQGTVSLWELGQQEPRMSEFVQLAALLEIQLPTLMERMGIPIEREWPSYRDWYREVRQPGTSDNHSRARTTKRGSARHIGSSDAPQVPLPEKWRYAGGPMARSTH